MGTEELGLALGSLAESLKGALPEAQSLPAAARPAKKQLTAKAKQKMM